MYFVINTYMIHTEIYMSLYAGKCFKCHTAQHILDMQIMSYKCSSWTYSMCYSSAETRNVGDIQASTIHGWWPCQNICTNEQHKCRINRPMSSTRKAFNYMRHFSVEKWWKMLIYVFCLNAISTTKANNILIDMVYLRLVYPASKHSWTTRWAWWAWPCHSETNVGPTWAKHWEFRGQSCITYMGPQLANHGHYLGQDNGHDLHMILRYQCVVKQGFLYGQFHRPTIVYPT